MAFSRSQPCQLEFLQQYLSTWFRGAAPDEIKRGNMEELFAYGFFYRTRWVQAVLANATSCVCVLLAMMLVEGWCWLVECRAAVCVWLASSTGLGG
jgi:hypothetical protein